MRRTFPVMALALVMFTAMAAGAQAHRGCRYDDDRTFMDKHIDLEDGVLTIEHHGEDWIVEITEDHELYVNGREVDTDRRQRKLLRRYYRYYEKIEEMAGEIGREAAKVGAAGAKIGVAAVVTVARSFLDDDALDDIDIDADVDTDEIERMADKLEKKAEKIEELADDLEKTHRKLRRSIPELRKLEDF